MSPKNPHYTAVKKKKNLPNEGKWHQAEPDVAGRNEEHLKWANIK